MTHEPISATVVIKNLLYIPAALAGISMENYSILGILLIIDVFTGVWRSAVISGGDSVTSWKGINGLISKFLVLLIPLVVAYMGHGIGIDLNAMVGSALGILITATGYSIIGNIYGIRTGKAVREFDAVRFLLLQVEKLLERIDPPHDKGKK